MKKRFLIFISLICTLFIYPSVHAESKEITCTQTLNNSTVHIQGQISDVVSSHLVTLVVCTDIDNMIEDNVVYINQTISKVDGTFEFSFNLPDAKSGTVYEYKIDSNADTDAYKGILNFGANTEDGNEDADDNEENSNEELLPEKTIICTSEIHGDEIVIHGQISNATTANLVTLIVSKDINNITSESIVYIDQTTSTTDGNFQFSFGIEDATAGENYGYKVDSNSGADSYKDIITIPPQTEMMRREFIDANVNVNIVNYVPSISGTITCVEGKTATINIVNTTDNTIVANDVLTEGVHNISYQLPSLVTAKKYTLNVTGSNGTQDLALLSVTIDSSVLLVTISGSVDIADGVIMDVSVQSNNTGLIDKSATITKDRTLSVTLPNIVSNTSYHLTATGYETVPVVIPEDTVIREEYIVSGSAGDSFKIIVTGTHLSSFDEILNLEYDSAQIKPTNLFGAYYEDSLQPGIKGDVEIVSYIPGLIQFRKVNRGIPNGKLWSGVLNIFEFEFNHDYSGDTTVCLYN